MSNLICKNDIEFVELLAKATGAISKNRSDPPDRGAQLRVKKLLQAFYQEPEKIKDKQLQGFQKNLQAVGVSTDFPVVIANAYNVVVQAQNFDLKWQQAFQEVTLGGNQDFWEIEDVSNSITFRKMEEGQRLEVSGVAASRVFAYVDYYGGALGWTDKMIRYRKIPNIINRAMLFRNAQQTTKANIHYALLAAAVIASGFVTGYQGAAALGQLQRDILTINTAILTLANRNLAKGYYADMESAPMIIYANPSNKPRIEAVFRAQTSDFAAAGLTGAELISKQITRFYTYNANNTAGTPLLVLPGGKLQRAQDMAPTTYRAPQDILTLNFVEAVWEIYGAICADNDQIQQFTLG